MKEKLEIHSTMSKLLNMATEKVIYMTYLHMQVMVITLRVTFITCHESNKSIFLKRKALSFSDFVLRVGGGI